MQALQNPSKPSAAAAKKKAAGSDLSSTRGSEERASVQPTGRGQKRGRDYEIEKVSDESSSLQQPSPSPRAPSPRKRARRRITSSQDPAQASAPPRTRKNPPSTSVADEQAEGLSALSQPLSQNINRFRRSAKQRAEVFSDIEHELYNEKTGLLRRKSSFRPPTNVSRHIARASAAIASPFYLDVSRLLPPTPEQNMHFLHRNPPFWSSSLYPAGPSIPPEIPLEKLEEFERRLWGDAQNTTDTRDLSSLSPLSSAPTSPTDPDQADLAVPASSRSNSSHRKERAQRGDHQEELGLDDDANDEPSSTGDGALKEGEATGNEGPAEEEDGLENDLLTASDLLPDPDPSAEEISTAANAINTASGSAKGKPSNQESSLRRGRSALWFEGEEENTRPSKRQRRTGPPTSRMLPPQASAHTSGLKHPKMISDGAHAPLPKQPENPYLETHPKLRKGCPNSASRIAFYENVPANATLAIAGIPTDDTPEEMVPLIKEFRARVKKIYLDVKFNNIPTVPKDTFDYVEPLVKEKGERCLLEEDTDFTNTLSAVQEETFNARPAVRIGMPDHLKSLLVDDWENVTKNLAVVPLPSDHPVNEILDTYFEEEKCKRRLGSADADLLEEVVAGVKEYFEKCVGRILLYRFEREQYFQIRKLWEDGADPKWEGKNAGDVYGAEHLCRLFGMSFSRSSPLSQEPSPFSQLHTPTPYHSLHLRPTPDIKPSSLSPRTHRPNEYGPAICQSPAR